MQDKRQLRAELRHRIAAMPSQTRERDSELIRQRLTGLPEWRSATGILLFHSLEVEPDLCPLLSEWFTGQGRVLALPALDAASGRYLPRAVIFAAGKPVLARGAFGIQEPGPGSPIVEWNRLDFVAVPGLGFTADGRRLGKGRGYYDRLLVEIRGFRCGIAWDEQVVADVPTGPHDAQLDCILTPRREWRCHRERA